MTTMTVDAAALAEAIDQVAPAASDDPELPLLQTVLLEAREGTLRLVATDRYRLAVRDLVARAGADASFRAVVSRAALERIRKGLGGDGRVDVTRHDHAVTIGGAADIPAMPAEFPPYEKLFVLDPAAHSVVADRAALAAALADAVGRDLLRLRLAPGRLTITVEGEGEQAARSLDVTYDGPELEVGLHPAFAHYAVASAVGPEVMVEITEPVRPVVFRSATDSSYICLVMPVKLPAHQEVAPA